MTRDADRKLWILTRLKHSLQALASSADLQCKLFPDFVCKADELALDFDHWYLCAKTNYSDDLSETQKAALSAVNNAFDLMSGLENKDCWTEDALHLRPEWEQIRVLARDTLGAFGWSLETPPSYASEFVRG